MTKKEAAEYLRGIGGKQLEAGSELAKLIAALLDPPETTHTNGATGMDPGIYEGTGAGFEK